MAMKISTRDEYDSTVQCLRKVSAGYNGIMIPNYKVFVIHEELYNTCFIIWIL